MFKNGCVTLATEGLHAPSRKADLRGGLGRLFFWDLSNEFYEFVTELPGGPNAEAHPRGNWVDTADLNDRKASIVGNGKAITNSHLAIGVFLNPRIVNKNWPPPFTKTFA